MNNKDFISRDVATKILSLSTLFPVITIVGPRQSGKTTLCRQLFQNMPYVDFERPDLLRALTEDPNTFINQYPKGAILDEAQRYPEIFSYLQVVVDEDRFQGTNNHQYIVSGSNNFSMLESVTQSMAGRTAVITLLPLSVKEIEKRFGRTNTDTLLINGGYPSLWTNDREKRIDLLSNYYSTYVERDVRRMVNVKNLVQFQDFLIMCASRAGSELNTSSIANDIGISVGTIKSWLNILIASYVVYLLPPFYDNIKKRLIKSPKIYFYDTGLLCHLIGINSEKDLATHPLRGSIFENMVVNEFIKKGYNKGTTSQIYFYRDKSREIDILKKIGNNEFEAYEIKSSRTYHKDYHSNLKYLKEIMGERIKKTVVVCDSDIENKETEQAFINFRNI